MSQSVNQPINVAGYEGFGGKASVVEFVHGGTGQVPGGADEAGLVDDVS